MSVHQIIRNGLVFSVCLILSLSVNYASAESLKCEKQLDAIDRLQVHDLPILPSDEPFFTMDGKSIRLSDFVGQTVILNHWAIWCPPCLREMPSLLRLSKQVEDKDAHIIPLSMDRLPPAKVEAFIKRKGWQEIPFYVDAKMGFARDTEVESIPVTQIIDKSGYEIARLLGAYEWDSSEVLDLIDCLKEG